jgi:hypothetical protein
MGEISGKFIWGQKLSKIYLFTIFIKNIFLTSFSNQTLKIQLKFLEFLSQTQIDIKPFQKNIKRVSHA